MARKQPIPFDPLIFLAKAGHGKTTHRYRKRQIIYSQGDAADAVFYLQEGRVKLSVLSKQGKEGVLAILAGAQQGGGFFGEACLSGQRVRPATAIALEASTIVRIDKPAMLRVIHDQPAFAELFIAHLLSRNLRAEEDLTDHLFNSSEKRLARLLLLLARFGKEGAPERIIPKVSQKTLAEMIGTTRPRVNFFMNKFRKLGFLDYNDGLEVHSSLLNVVLHD